MKKLLNLGLSLVLALGLCSVQGVKAETDTDGNEIIKNDETGIPDKALYQVILKEGDSNGDGALTKKEAKQITNLMTNRDSGITNLKGIENLINLTKLFLEYNNISDITPLKNLTNLTRLELANNNISDITALESLSNLTELGLIHNNISDIMPLKNLTNLTVLCLGGNNISDITALKNLTNLTFLYLYDNNISDIIPLRNLTNLGLLNLCDNNLTRLPDLKGLLKLDPQFTWLSGNKLTEAELKAKMPSRLASNQEWIDRNKFVDLTIRNLKADSYGKNKVKLTWDKVNDAEGYIIYRKVGNGSFAYRYMVEGTSFTDTTASGTEYNYYRVYPYYYNEKGERVVGKSVNYKYAKGVLPAVYNLQATPAGKKKVTVSWHSVPDAEGYAIYRKVGNGDFSYRYMVKGTSFTDTTASSTEFNFYRVYPYHTEKGQRVFGLSNNYKYAKGVLRAVTNLKATTAGKNKVKVTWDPTVGAEGYIIYRKVGNGKFEYRYMVKGTSFTDTTASNSEYNFYRIYPYYTENGQRIIGDSNVYKYAKGTLK